MRGTPIVAAAVLLASLLVGVTSTARAAGAEPGTALPAGPLTTPKVLRVDQGMVYATWASGTVPPTLYRTPADGTGSWTPVTDPETGQPITNPGLVGDGIVVTQRLPDPDRPGCTDNSVVVGSHVWKGPQPTDPGACNQAVLIGSGADLFQVIWPTTPGHTETEVYDAAVGPGAGPVAAYVDQTPVLAGTWAWTVGDGALHGRDLLGGQADRTVPLPADCGFVELQRVVGDPGDPDAMAMVWCSGSQNAYVVPLDGRRPLYLATPYWSLGNGFAYDFESGPAGYQIRVMDFSGALTQHVYGVGTGTRPVGSVDGPPTVAFTEGRTIYTAPLSWLGTYPEPADDTTPPTIDSTSGSPALVGGDPAHGQPVEFGWSGSDNLAGALAYDVQVTGTGSSTFTHEWHTYGSSEALTLSSPNVSGVCFQVRATDRVGNVSDWSSPRCTRIDWSPPDMADQRSDTWYLPHILNTTTRSRVVDRFHGSDDLGITSYDVQQRVAPPGADFGDWTSPAAWQAITAGQVSRMLTPGAEVCFRSRAHDVTGRVSSWGDRHCFVAPYDDARLVAHGRTTTGSPPHALGGSYTRLEDWHASVTRAGLVGRGIAVRERILHHEIDCLEVTWGGRPLGHCGGDQEGTRYDWTFALSSHPHRGVVRVKGQIAQLTDVDAIAVVR